MKIRITFDFDARSRAALSHHLGRRTLATRDELARHIHAIVDAAWIHYGAELDADEAKQAVEV